MTSDLGGEYVLGLERGFMIIKAFSADFPALTISQAAARTRLTRAVVRRYLLTLEVLGYVQRHGTLFAPTPKLLDLGYAYLKTLTVADVAQPHLERVVKRLNESSSVAVLDHYECVYVARVASRRIVTSNLAVGSRVPAHATALGHVLLAHLSKEALDEYFAKVPRAKLTARTICDEGRLRKILGEVRGQGWAFADEQFVVGRRTIAAGIYDRDGHVTAAINVAAAVAQVSTQEMLKEQLPVLLHAARSISRMLGAEVPRVTGGPQRRGPRLPVVPERS